MSVVDYTDNISINLVDCLRGSIRGVRFAHCVFCANRAFS